MERKNIAFQYGIHRSPSAANEGELSECINLEVHNGEITPSVMPEVAFTLSEGDKLLFVHKSGNYKNFIIQRESNLCWFPDEDKDSVSTIGEITPKSIHSVGNTLVVLSENSMEYILFKSGNYKRIGSKPPFCSISFGLKPSDNRYLRQYGTISRDEVTDLYPSLVTQLDKYITDGGDYTFDLRSMYEDMESTGSDNRLEVSNMVSKMTELYHAALNKAKAAGANSGYFSDSFFIRYAYRMYDGSHYMHSAPCFFPICTDGYPSTALVSSTLERGTSTFTHLGIGLEVLRLVLDYKISGLYNEGVRVEDDKLTDWEDIIEGIDIFVTNDISKVNADSRIYGFSNIANKPSGIFYVGKPRVDRGEIDTNKFVNNSYKNTSGFYLDVEKDSNEVFFEKIKEQSLFYKISSFGIKSLEKLIKNGNREILSIKKGLLTILEQQEVLEDDYDSHNKIIPSFAHVYNGRLNISGIRSKIFNGYPMESMVPYTYDPEENNYFWYIQTKLDVEGREITVVSESNVQLREKPAFIYYPNANVTEFTLNRYNGESGDPGFTTLTYYFAKFAAEKHKLLNGSFYLSTTFGVGDSYTLITSSGSPEPSGDPYIEYPNKIYTSEVNNPFFFPLSGRNSIGTGEIVAITSNTKAISPGQFGEYPLIVFSTDGVWAMQTGEEGLYYGAHPISKDICINPNILQTDGPVLFVTDNGLHSIVSDSVENISRIIKGKPDNINIPEVDDKFTLLSTISEDADTFNEFIRIAVFAFDYVNRRVIMSHPDKPFAYVYSMDSGMFSKMVILKEGNPVILGGAINAYPEIYMQSGTDIYTFVADKDSVEELSHGLLVTRPLVFSDPLAMKVVNDLRLIYHKTKEGTRCRYAMLVSNDGRTWKQRGSLRGHSFKYFRFAVFTELSDIDTLQGMSLIFDYRRTHKLR